MPKKILLYLTDARLAKLGDKPAQAIYKLIDEKPGLVIEFFEDSQLNLTPEMKKQVEEVRAELLEERPKRVRKGRGIMRGKGAFDPQGCRDCRMKGSWCGEKHG